MKRSGLFRRTVVLTSLVAALGGHGIVSAARAGEDSAASRGWMADLVRESEDSGYAVAGLSPASGRFIPRTPWAAWSLRAH